MSVQVNGTVAAGWETVRAEFEAVVAAERHSPEAQLAVRHHGRTVVDLWAGEDTDGETLTGVFSISKGAAHLVVALLVQDGVLELDRPVVSYWPEFTGDGKERLTVRSWSRTGPALVNTPEGFTIEELADDALVAARLAATKPYWEPGTAYGYHALVIAALTGEVVRRVTGRSVQEVYEERVRAPYGLDLYLGLPHGGGVPLEAGPGGAADARAAGDRGGGAAARADADRVQLAHRSAAGPRRVRQPPPGEGAGSGVGGRCRHGGRDRGHVRGGDQRGRR